MKSRLALVALVAGLLAPVGPTTQATASDGGSERVGPAPSAPMSVPAARRLPGNDKLSAGGEHSCIPSGGSLWCWGRDSFGQLGDGTLGGMAAAAQKVKGKNWKKVSAGGADTCGIKKNGILLCWGVNNRGQVGDGSTKVRTKPARVAGKKKRWRQVSASWFTTCGITKTRRLYCWGDNDAGQLGNGNHKRKTKPTKVRGKNWKQVTVGSRYVCAVKKGGALYCWGGNLFGHLGTGSYGARAKPTRIAGAWRKVDTSWSHTCAVAKDGAVSCWGRNSWGQLGDGTRNQSPSPRQVSGGLKAKDVTVGEGFSCLLTTSGRVWCWGDNAYGIFGEGQTPWSATPVGGPSQVKDIDAGWRHVCGISTAGGRFCWGQNDRAQLGDGTTDSSPWPTEVQPTPAAAAGGGTTFRLGSLNVLGNGHTRPYAKDDRFGPSTTRATWSADALDATNMDVVGLQETNSDQLSHLLKAARGTWDSWPKPEAGDLAVEAPLLWRTSVWQAVETRTIETQFISRVLPRPVVRLRHKATGQEIWVMNVHNAPWDYQKKRNTATKAQLATIADLRATTGLPVFYVGDMNEKREILCKTLSQTDLVSPYGGSYDPATGRCTNPPHRMRVDWIFGSPEATYADFEMNRNPLVAISTDHSFAMVTVHLP